MSIFPKRALAKNYGWMLIGQGTGYGLRIIYFVLIARLLGASQYGVVVGAFAFVNIVAHYSRLGTGMVLLRYVSAERTRFAVYWGNILMVTVAVSVIITGAVPLIAPHVLDAASASIVVFTAVGSCLCEQLTISATQVFQALEMMPLTATLNILTSLVRAATAGVMLITLHHANAWQWAIASMSVSALAAIVALGTVTKKCGLPRFSFSLLREHLGEGFEYAIASSTTNIYDDLDKVMLSHFGMDAAVGVYAMAYRIIELATMPIASIQLAVEPRLFQLGASGLRPAAALGRRLLSKGILLSCLIAVLSFVVAPVIPLVVGHGFGEAVSALRWLCLIPVFRSVHYITGSVLTSAGLQRYRTTGQFVAAALNFFINLFLIPRYGWHGAAWASLITDGALALMNWSVLSFAMGRCVERPPVPQS